MELFNSPFFMVEDKELALQILRTNNVHAIEIVEPKTSAYPIIGRKFGHHGGQDLTIIQSREQSLDLDFDFYTKLYTIEHEYRIEVKGLNIVKIQQAAASHVKVNEIPIRSHQYGWKWEDVQVSDFPEEWLQIAIRSVYILGLTHGYVKIGELANESPIVIDINPLGDKIKTVENRQKPLFTLGADIEFMLNCEDELIPASEFFPVEGPIGCDERQIEQDSGEYALGEIRPEPSESPYELFQNIKGLIGEASEIIPYCNISFRAGSMPFFGYQCGGHLHFGIEPTVHLLRALDYFLAIPLAMIEEPSTGRRRRKTKHGGLGRIRKKPYGFEYLSLSSWIIEPEIALATLCLAKLVVTHYHELNADYLFHPLTQRAYYQGNKVTLKHLWDNIKEQITSTKDYSLYQSEIKPLFTYIENNISMKEKADIRDNWGLTIPQQTYDRGQIIQIPRKTRVKFNLIEGQDAYICAGKSMAKAMIRPYPFTFRHSNIIQLSAKLREQLSLPKDWIPKISSANGALILGPIMGILADRPFDRQGTYFQHLSKIAKLKQMLIYVFEPKDIVWEKGLIKGTTMDGEGLFPFPAVIYDRYFRNTKNQNKEVEEIRAKLEYIHQIPFINSPKLFDLTGDKWKSHQILVEEHSEYLPDTRILQHSSDITEMLDIYGDIFLKPLGGALGKGIIRMVQTSSGINWMHSKERSYHRLQEIDELMTKFPALQKSDAYLVQESVKRKQLNGNYVEIRVYMQKNGQQKWVRTGMVARLTNEGVMTEDTEINKRSTQVLSKMYENPAELRAIKKQIAQVTRNVVETIEDEVGAFGELAVDITMDQYNSIKILEINAKPDNLFSQVNAYKLRHLAAVRLLNYATTLASFEWDENE